jgi:ankyrin repeat protein
MVGRSLGPYVMCTAIWLSWSYAAARGDDIHAAVRRNDLTAVEAMIRKDPTCLNDRSGDQTPLHEAAAYVGPDMVRLLLKHGAEVNAIAYNGFTPLHVVRNPESVSLLIKAGADVDKKDAWGLTPLQSVIREDWLGVADALLDAGAPLDIASALMMKRVDEAKTILAEHPEVVKASGSRSDLRCDTSLLGLAATSGDLDLIEKLVETGADVKGGTMMPNLGGMATPISNAVWSGKADVVRYLLEHGAAPQGVGGKFYDSIFEFAIRHSTPEIVELLLTHGALKSVMDDGQLYWHAPLAIAAGAGELEKVRLLLQHAPDVFSEEDMRRGLFVAALNQHADVVAFLRTRGAKPDIFISAMLGETEVVLEQLKDDPKQLNSKDPAVNRSLLSWAIASGQNDLVRRLLELAPDVNDRTQRREPVMEDVLYETAWLEDANEEEVSSSVETPLSTAVGQLPHAPDWKPNLTIIELLLECGAQPVAGKSMEDTPLFIAIESKDTALVKVLLDHGADPNVSVEGGWIPLSAALKSPEIVRILLDHGANPNCERKSQYNVLDIAVHNGCLSSATELLRSGAELSLYSACALGHVDFLRKELAANPSIRDRRVSIFGNKNSLLEIATLHGQLEVVRLLLDAGASATQADLGGNTPMQYAAKGGVVPVAKLLLEHGSTIDTKDASNTLLRLAVMHGKTEMVKFLLDAEAGDPICGESPEGTLLHVAAYRSDNAEIATLLIAQGTAVDAPRMRDGQTALHIAAITGSPAVVKVLLDHGADPNLRDMRGKTALGWARWNRSLDDLAKTARKQDVETLLLSHGGK